jgi:hypothetical protein
VEAVSFCPWHMTECQRRCQWTAFGGTLLTLKTLVKINISLHVVLPVHSVWMSSFLNYPPRPRIRADRTTPRASFWGRTSLSPTCIRGYVAARVTLQLINWPLFVGDRNDRAVLSWTARTLASLGECTAFSFGVFPVQQMGWFALQGTVVCLMLKRIIVSDLVMKVHI